MDFLLHVIAYLHTHVMSFFGFFRSFSKLFQKLFMSFLGRTCYARNMKNATFRKLRISTYPFLKYTSSSSALVLPATCNVPR